MRCKQMVALLTVLPMILLAGSTATLHAQAPESVAYQGFLTDDGGAPVDGVRDITVRLWNDLNAGVQVWSRLYDNVVVSDGVFNLILSNGTPFLSDVSFHDPLYVELAVGPSSGSTAPTVLPRTALTSVPTALSLRGLRIEVPLDAAPHYGAINIVGGYNGNRVENDADGVVIAGGGSANTDESQVVSGNYGTISGGTGNTVSGSGATVGGGTINEASGQQSTVSGGDHNVAAAYQATIGGGQENKTEGERSTIGGGRRNQIGVGYDPDFAVASTICGGDSNIVHGVKSFIGGGAGNVVTAAEAVVAGGRGNAAWGAYSVVPGGYRNLAESDGSFAAGTRANAAHEGTFVWSDRSAPTQDFSSTMANSFLIRASGGVGIDRNDPTAQLHIGKANGSGNGVKITSVEGDDTSMYYWGGGLVFDNYHPTNGRRVPILIQPGGGRVGIGTYAPQEELHVVDPTGSSIIAIGEEGNGGPHGIVFKDQEAGGGGVQLLWRTSPNQLVIERSEDPSVNGSDAWYYDRDDDHFYASSGNTGADNSAATHAMHIENTATAAGGDVLALSVDATSAGIGNNFVTFFAEGQAIGAVQSNATGTGITVSTTSADYAEMVPLAPGSLTPSAGDVVGLSEGLVSHATAGSQRIFVVTEQASVLGNVPIEDEAAPHVPLAFVGQVPVQVRGPVKVGDFIVPSGRDDGTGIAVAPAALRLDQVGSIVGRAWRASELDGEHRVTIEVGLDQTVALVEIIRRQQRQIDRLLEVVGHDRDHIAAGR